MKAIKNMTAAAFGLEGFPSRDRKQKPITACISNRVWGEARRNLQPSALIEFEPAHIVDPVPLIGHILEEQISALIDK
jgi:hypothetical protein